jgi:hypothetical protein
MTYTDLEKILRANHFYPKIEKSIHLKGISVTGLIVDCPATILMDSKVARIRAILAENGVEGYRVDGMPNSMEIVITKVK